jgi:hypothetical protein
MYIRNWKCSITGITHITVFPLSQDELTMGGLYWLALQAGHYRSHLLVGQKLATRFRYFTNNSIHST